MANIILAVVLLLLVGGAVAYIIKERKNGVKCIGCPSGCNCAGKHEAHGAECSDCHCEAH
ncbi:MAG: FeoB-associated Cys-rich membrane protein [Lachnospiraceae bacterium]